MKISKTLYIRYLFALLLPLSGLLQACDMIEYHPYDLDIDGETEVNARNIQRIETALDGKRNSHLPSSATPSDGMTRRKTPWPT